MGQIGLSSEEFNTLTPVEFYYAYLGWADLEHSRLKQAWERDRWVAWVLTSIQIEKKDRCDMTAMYPLPWEDKTIHTQKELTMEERRNRVTKILNGK
ncbi:MAG: hypothetical protein R3Y49_05605 [Rikenellaceae bacterium]